MQIFIVRHNHFHDAFQSSSFTSQSQPFLTFTESYLQKYGDRSSNKLPLTANYDGMDDIKEKDNEEDDNDDDDKEQERQFRSASAELNRTINQNKKLHKSKTPDLERIRTTIASRNTNTPSSTPQGGYNDALRDGLLINNGKFFKSYSSNS